MYKTALQILVGLSFVTIVLGLLFVCTKLIMAILPFMIITLILFACIYGLGMLHGNNRRKGCYNHKRRKF